MNQFQLTSICDLSRSGQGEIVALNVGPDSRLYVVTATDKPDYQGARPYRVRSLEGDVIVLDFKIQSTKFRPNDVQPLPDGRILLVSGRSRRRGPDDFDKNGRIYDFEGNVQQEILLGDGIQSTQTTSAGVIWTSFFDESVFGNFGWSDPIGASGLVAWDSSGKKLYEFQPLNGLDTICDCYGLNVASDASTWIYYYTPFPLVHLRNMKIESHWAMPIAGSDAFAVAQGIALFRGGYKSHDHYHLFELGAGKVREIASFDLTDQSGDQITARRAVGRAGHIYVVKDGRVFQCDVTAVAERFV